MISVEHLVRRYGDFTAVEDVSFTIRKGEIVGLLGHNGAGKTTIMKMLTGYLEPSAGRIRINDLDITRNADAVQAHIGYLPENLPIYPEMYVADYLDYVASLRGLQGARRSEALRRVIEQTELQSKSLQPISTLSRGYRQRVGVAQAILHQPQVVILDEPTNGLDPTQTQHMRSLIQGLAVHATVLLSTHIMQEVDAICSRVLILGNGRLVVDESMRDLRRDRHLLLRTDWSLEAVQRALTDLPEVQTVEAVAGEPPTCRLILQDGSDSGHIGAQVNRRLVEAGAQVYAMHPQQRSLEALFREVSSAGEAGHVA